MHLSVLQVLLDTVRASINQLAEGWTPEQKKQLMQTELKS